MVRVLTQVSIEEKPTTQPAKGHGCFGAISMTAQAHSSAVSSTLCWPGPLATSGLENATQPPHTEKKRCEDPAMMLVVLLISRKERRRKPGNKHRQAFWEQSAGTFLDLTLTLTLRHASMAPRSARPAKPMRLSLGQPHPRKEKGAPFRSWNAACAGSHGACVPAGTDDGFVCGCCDGGDEFIALHRRPP